MSKGIIVDIGTGDGKFVYKLAKENPGRFIIGIDPYQQGMKEVSTKIYKKEKKGGLKNTMYVLASIEDLPRELDGLANQIFINFPWGSLLQGIFNVNENVWNNIKRICQKGAIVDIVSGYDKETEGKKIREAEDLGDLDLDYVNNKMKKGLEKLGIKLIKARELNKEELKQYPSSWSKKLSFGEGKRKYFYLRLKIVS